MIRTRPLNPWRKVTYIESRDTRRGGTHWTLTLECGHVAFRYAPNRLWRMIKPATFAPHKVRCLCCGLKERRGRNS